LTSHSHAAALVANGAVLGEKTLADDFRVGRSGGASSGTGDFGIVDIGFEATAVTGKVKSTPENENSGENDKPERER
jgi:hypothetical protein